MVDFISKFSNSAFTYSDGRKHITNLAFLAETAVTSTKGLKKRTFDDISIIVYSASTPSDTRKRLHTPALPARNAVLLALTSCLIDRPACFLLDVRKSGLKKLCS